MVFALATLCGRKLPLVAAAALPNDCALITPDQGNDGSPTLPIDFAAAQAESSKPAVFHPAVSLLETFHCLLVTKRDFLPSVVSMSACNVNAAMPPRLVARNGQHVLSRFQVGFDAGCFQSLPRLSAENLLTVHEQHKIHCRRWPRRLPI